MGYLDKECRGCRFGAILFCHTKNFVVDGGGDKSYYCPCMNCILKPICSKVCEDLKSYRKIWR